MIPDSSARKAARLICIPVEEIEAWFLADRGLVSRRVAHGRKCRDYLHPHAVVRPKELLQRLSCDAGGHVHYSTNDNHRLAAELSLDVCAARCPAFADLRRFVVEATL